VTYEAPSAVSPVQRLIAGASVQLQHATLRPVPTGKACAEQSSVGRVCWKVSQPW